MEHFFEEVVREDVIDEAVTCEDYNIVPFDLDREPLSVLRRSVFGVGTRLEGEVELVLLLFGAEEVGRVANDATAAVAEVGEPQFIISEDGEECGRGADRALRRSSVNTSTRGRGAREGSAPPPCTPPVSFRKPAASPPPDLPRSTE